jgi:hypothetical protein
MCADDATHSSNGSAVRDVWTRGRRKGREKASDIDSDNVIRVRGGGTAQGHTLGKDLNNQTDQPTSWLNNSGLAILYSVRRWSTMTSDIPSSHSIFLPTSRHPTASSPVPSAICLPRRDDLDRVLCTIELMSVSPHSCC